MAVMGGATLLNPTVAATMSVTLDGSVRLQHIKFTATMNVRVDLLGTPNEGQELILVIANDATPRTITLGNGFLTNKGTIIGVASKRSICHFIADAGVFLETNVRNIGL